MLYSVRKTEYKGSYNNVVQETSHGSGLDLFPKKDTCFRRLTLILDNRLETMKNSVEKNEIIFKDPVLMGATITKTYYANILVNELY